MGEKEECEENGCCHEYINESRSVVVVYVEQTRRYFVKGHPDIPVATCPTCGGYRFQRRVEGSCKGQRKYAPGGRILLCGSCLHAREFCAYEFRIVASRYVKRCRACGRLYVSGGGKSSSLSRNLHCWSADCTERVRVGRGLMPTWGEIRLLLLAWSKDVNSLIHRAGVSLAILQHIIEVGWECVLPCSLSLKQSLHRRRVYRFVGNECKLIS
jgi:hypothetical protein